ncbi:hypothetical protein PGT21_028592 [Puccinia graminis f. sp. tritici]|uniref:Uncharacterized protein n=1 Tax=Puccinia graminis f. sp. tritici TaxID=56615 RepID=A0A5B0RSW6_PUCGR|nr:hypothetical protein PGT21_028592 [Puccinia graminis f. sp. tritici]KAA1127963.1 hypothetical protein PGTUg99_008926 [Puccinia graminis f. sp. tritici]
MEYLLRNAEPSSQKAGRSRRRSNEEEEEGEESKKEEVERDEYGIALRSSRTTTVDAEPAAATPASSASKELKIGGSTVSKLLPPQVAVQSTTPEELHTAAEIHPPAAATLLQLHNLVLDHPHSQLQHFLTTSSLALRQPHEFSKLINGYLNGYTAFHQACDIGDLKKVEMLCGAGVDRGLKDEMDGLTGIELAREAGRTEVVGFLSSL